MRYRWGKSYAGSAGKAGAGADADDEIHVGSWVENYIGLRDRRAEAEAEAEFEADRERLDDKAVAGGVLGS